MRYEIILERTFAGYVATFENELAGEIRLTAVHARPSGALEEIGRAIDKIEEDGP